MRKIVNITALLLISVAPNAAWSYIDPGTGSAVIQGVIAAVAAIGVTVKLYWHRLISFFGQKKEESEDQPIDDDKSPS